MATHDALGMSARQNRVLHLNQGRLSENMPSAESVLS